MLLTYISKLYKCCMVLYVVGITYIYHHSIHSPLPLSTSLIKKKMILLLQLLRMSSIFINTYYKIFYNYKIIALKCLVCRLMA